MFCSSVHIFFIFHPMFQRRGDAETASLSLEILASIQGERFSSKLISISQVTFEWTPGVSLCSHRKEAEDTQTASFQ